MDAGRPYPDGIAWDEAWFQRQRAEDAEMAIRRLANQDATLSLLCKMDGSQVVTVQMDAAEWIPVSERLPEEGVDVLVFTKEGKFDSRPNRHVASFDEDGEWYPSHGDGYMFPVVTHWMPLPEPPEVK
jgi:hypothetical protein